ncbi:hypothetical protein CRE_26703 [Caenorhabditis remanei]|uniref:Uncharacterized protein n=1 Tax=Caenorhabditis remanei TaxID=31234 RepID=E3ML26_CAERE|nr:hypothetical protein CRE_26703 [Caenorhabditis remanei]
MSKYGKSPTSVSSSRDVYKDASKTTPADLPEPTPADTSSTQSEMSDNTSDNNSGDSDEEVSIRIQNDYDTSPVVRAIQEKSTPPSAPSKRTSRCSASSGRKEEDKENVPTSFAKKRGAKATETRGTVPQIFPKIGRLSKPTPAVVQPQDWEVRSVVFKPMDTAFAYGSSSREYKELRETIKFVKNKLETFKSADEVTPEWISSADQVVSKLSCMGKNIKELVLANNKTVDTLQRACDIIRGLHGVVAGLVATHHQESWHKYMANVVGSADETCKLVRSLTAANGRIEGLLMATAPAITHAIPYKLVNTKSENPRKRAAKRNRGCTLCNKRTHNTKSCRKYPTSVDKIRRANKLNICLQCLKKFPKNDTGSVFCGLKRQNSETGGHRMPRNKPKTPRIKTLNIFSSTGSPSVESTPTSTDDAAPQIYAEVVAGPAVPAGPESSPPPPMFIRHPDGTEEVNPEAYIRRGYGWDGAHRQQLAGRLARGRIMALSRIQRS